MGCQQAVPVNGRKRPTKGEDTTVFPVLCLTGVLVIISAVFPKSCVIANRGKLTLTTYLPSELGIWIAICSIKTLFVKPKERIVAWQAKRRARLSPRLRSFFRAELPMCTCAVHCVARAGPVKEETCWSHQRAPVVVISISFLGFNNALRGPSMWNQGELDMYKPVKSVCRLSSLCC